MQDGHVLIVISAEIILLHLLIVFHVIPLTIMVPPILIIRPWHFQPPAPSATQQILAGSRQHTHSMTVSSFQYIQVIIRGNGAIAVNAIQPLPIIHCLTVLIVIVMNILGKDIQMQNVTVAIPEGLHNKAIL
jgi:hypothetical protein